METQEWRTLDKSKWGRGPWQDEPDKVQWADATTGLPCLAVRAGSLGHWCGYVGVAPGHPWHGKEYSAVDADVHGGLTFSAKSADLTPEAWAQWRVRLAGRRAEATEYPRGDAAEDLRTWRAALDSYETWVAESRARAICHLPAPGEPDNVWWLGFDCAHLGDVSPGTRARLRDLGFPRDAYEQYRPLAYVQAECAKLAEQAVAKAP